MRLKIRVVFDDGSFLGPGKADLLEGIAKTGSIAGAGRGMNMSYKRAWSLVSTMNEMFDEPVVSSVRGGVSGGHAELTAVGRAVLAAYRDVEARAFASVKGRLGELEAHANSRNPG